MARWIPRTSRTWEKVREIRGPRNEFDKSPRNEFLQKSAKSEVRGMNFHKSPRNPSPRNKFLQKSAKSEVRGMNFYKSLQNPKFLGIIWNATMCCFTTSFCDYLCFYLWQGAPAVGLAQCNNFGLQLWFFAVSLPTSDCPPRALTYRPCGQAQHPLLVIRYRVAAENRKRYIMRNPCKIMK